MFRFDAQVFKGKNRPVRTCCFCKEDGHIKTQCPDLRKPPLRPLPPMTQQFGDVLEFACRTCRSKHSFKRDLLTVTLTGNGRCKLKIFLEIANDKKHSNIILMDENNVKQPMFVVDKRSPQS